MEDSPQPEVESPYPRPEATAKSDKNWFGCAGAFGLLIIACLSMCCGGAQLLAEGPHGPNGEITNDPSIVWMLPLFCGLGLVLGLISIWLFAWSFGWRRKR